MGKSKKKELTFPQKMNKLMHAGVDNNQMIYNRQHDLSSIESLDERIKLCPLLHSKDSTRQSMYVST